MSAFYDLIDEYLGDSDSLSDIRATVRRLWFYDFLGEPTRVWQGMGTLITEDGLEWIGTIDGNGNDHHETTSLQDGRDGSSATYTFGLTIPDLPGEPARKLFDDLKSNQSMAAGRSLTCYLAIIKEDEALRPLTPYVFLKQLTMIQPKFSEKVERNEASQLVQKYKVSISAKDANYGRFNTPKGTYADTVQKRRAAELGVSLDRGSEHLAALANRSYVIP